MALQVPHRRFRFVCDSLLRQVYPDIITATVVIGFCLYFFIHDVCIFVDLEDLPLILA